MKDERRRLTRRLGSIVKKRHSIYNYRNINNSIHHTSAKLFTEREVVKVFKNCLTNSHLHFFFTIDISS